jgi:hypothetical protein
MMIKIIFKNQLLLLVCFVIAFGCITSCKKDANVNSGKVELLSFGPSGAQHGDTIVFIGNNLDKVTSIRFVNDSIPAAGFIKQTSEQIKLILPQTTEEGLVILRTATGSVVSKTLLNFTVTTTVTSVTAQARPGANITIKGQYVNWITQIMFAKDIPVKTFVSKSLNQLVVTVPINARSGILTFTYGGSKPLSFDSNTPLIVTLPTITGISPNPIAKGGNLTITGTDLDLVGGISFKGIANPVTTFVSQSATQIVVAVPATANRGTVTLVAKSGLTVESSASLKFIGDLPDLAPLGYAIYEDALQGNWQNWGWGTTVDFVNTENVRDGAASIKLNYTGNWSALKFANGNVATAPYTELTFSIFGTTGTDGKVIHVQPSGGSNYPITIQEGKWVEFKIPLSQLGSPATITDIMFQNESWTGIVYMDHVGLR